MTTINSKRTRINRSGSGNDLNVHLENVFSGVDTLLHLTDSLSKSRTTADLRAVFQNQPGDYLEDKYPQIVQNLPAHGDAFERGLISCERLFEVLVPPFLKLLNKVSAKEDPPADSLVLKACNNLFTIWHKALAYTLAGDYDQDSSGDWKYVQILGPRKRAQFVRTLMAAKFPEVRTVRKHTTQTKVVITQMSFLWSAPNVVAVDMF